MKNFRVIVDDSKYFLWFSFNTSANLRCIFYDIIVIVIKSKISITMKLINDKEKYINNHLEIN